MRGPIAVGVLIPSKTNMMMMVMLQMSEVLGCVVMFRAMLQLAEGERCCEWLHHKSMMAIARETSRGHAANMSVYPTAEQLLTIDGMEAARKVLGITRTRAEYERRIDGHGRNDNVVRSPCLYLVLHCQCS
jgi:hypothetical protein